MDLVVLVRDRGKDQVHALGRLDGDVMDRERQRDQQGTVIGGDTVVGEPMVGILEDGRDGIGSHGGGRGRRARVGRGDNVGVLDSAMVPVKIGLVVLITRQKLSGVMVSEAGEMLATAVAVGLQE